MKKVFLSCALIIFTTSVLLAQTSFEGTIKWSMALGSADGKTAAAPELTAKQQAELKDGIAQLEKQLNDPQMQAMFQSNPSLKTTLEQQLQSMKLMQGEGGVNSLLPKSITVKMKSGNSLTTMNGGAMAAMGDVLYLKASDKTYYIKKAAKTYSVAPKQTPPATTTEDKSATKVTPTTETKKILTYTCTKYIVTTTDNGKTQIINVWATKDLKQYDPKSFHTSSLGQSSTENAMKSIDGVPLRIEASEKGQTVVMEVIEFTSGALPAADFAIPVGFKEVPFGQ